MPKTTHIKKPAGLPPRRLLSPHNLERMDHVRRNHRVRRIPRKTSPRVPCAAAPKAANELSAFGKNDRLRKRRREAWRKAATAARYWRALFGFTEAVSIARMYGLKEARAYAETSREEKPGHF